MKTIVSKIAFIKLLLILAQYTYGQTWTTWNDSTESSINFEAKFPAPNQKIEKIKTGGAIYDERFLVTTLIGREASDSFNIFVIVHHEIPEKMREEIRNDSLVLNKFFENTLASFVDGFQPKDLQFVKYNYQNYLGHEASCKIFNGTGTMRARIIRIKNSIFLLCAGGNGLNTYTIEFFLESFLVKK